MKSKMIHVKNKCICDSCGAEFIIDPKKKKFPDGIEISYFECSKCGKKYVFFVSDTNLRKQIRIQTKSHRIIYPWSDLKRRADKLKKEYADRIKEL